MTETVNIARAADLLDSDVVLVERRLRAGVLPHDVVDAEVRIPLADLMRLRADEQSRSALLLEISQTFEEL